MAISVYEEMKVRGIAPTTATCAALISVAERTGHDYEAVQIYREISKKGSNIQLSTNICDAWSAVFLHLITYVTTLHIAAWVSPYYLCTQYLGHGQVR